ncbi:MAG TPA: HDIG domain-containing protein [Candidatus Pygmaiobacter gallistercoris]|nr:HDIG domain-containing protein [Candidatus Pygmaiobacter gallistercoris]
MWNEEDRTAFLELVSPLLQETDVQKMRDFSQHAEGISCYDHSLFVSYLSFLMARRLGLDCRAAARGGLLHDLHLCHWENTDVGRARRLVLHPQLALQNAEKFGLDDRERDIIVKHMWPLTRPLPRYRESFVVSLADKICATAEMLHLYRSSKVQFRLQLADAY